MTDPEKSPYFHKWRYDGNAVQRQLKVGPRSAIFSPTIPEKHIIQALEEEDGDALLSMKMAFQSGSQVWDGMKTVKPTRWWIEFAEGKSESYEQLYKKSAWAFRCIEIRSQALSQIPWQVVDQAENEVDSGPFVDLLNNVNPESNWSNILMGTEADLCVFGFSVWKKIKRGPFIQRLIPSMVEIDRDNTGIRGFKYGNDKTLIPRDEAVYFHTYNPQDDQIGLSPLDICRLSIDVEAMANQHMSEFFENRAMPQYIFSAETNDQNELNRLAKSWHQLYGGKGNQFKTAFVGGKSEPKQMGYAPEQLALKDVREEARKSVCAALGVPPVLVGAWEAANYATADEQRQSLYTETIIPRAEYIKNVINAELAADFGDQLFEWEYDSLPVMQEDAESQANRLSTLVREKIIKPEVAAEEMGYDAADVPEPEPVPDVLKPFTQGGEENTSVKPEEEELAKWQKKALRRLRDGKTPAVAFESEVLDHNMSMFILGALEDAKTMADVKRAFAKGKSWKGYP